MKILLVLLVFVLGCSSTQVQRLDPAIYYRNDICFEYKTDKKVRDRQSEVDDIFNGGFGAPKYKNEIAKFCGTGVLPFKDSYKLKVISYGKLNFFSLMSCHEEDTSENPDRGIFKKNGVVRVTYRPTLEKKMNCPLYVSAYNKKQRHAFGVIVFENPRFQLQATVKCNGYTRNANGVSICQSRQGLIQEISFKEEVKAVRPVVGAAERHEACPVLDTKDNKSFMFKLPVRECVYQFIGKESKKIHRFYAIGYEDIIVRQ